MRPLLKIMLILMAGFTVIFALMNLLGWFDLETIKLWLAQAQEWSPAIVSLIVIMLLVADLFFTVPTLALSLLSGFLLGQWLGFVTVAAGLMLSGSLGYWLSFGFGEKIFSLLLKDKNQREEAANAFHQHGVVMILLSRAAPMLPEVTACMAGLIRMPFLKFSMVWLASALPYAAITTYAGSVSSMDNPKPALFAAVGLSGCLWLAWFIFNKRQQRLRSSL